MSCEGPVLPVCPRPQHPAAPPVSRALPAMALNPRIRRVALSQCGRNRSSSASDHQLLQVPNSVALSPGANSAFSGTENPESSLPTSLSLSPCSLQPPGDYLRSSSLPRNVRGSSAEPAPYLLSSQSADRELRAALSPRFIRRTATVDTNMISKEEYDVSV